MNKKTLLMVFVPMFLFGSIFVAWAGWVLASQPRHEITKRTEPIKQDVLWSLIQDWRIASERPPYTVDSKLCDYADSRVKEIQNDFDHQKFVDMEKSDNFTTLSENASKNTNTEKQTLDAWLASHTHRSALEDQYTHSCLRCESNYCVQIFGRY